MSAITPGLVVVWAISTDHSTGDHLGYGLLVGPSGLVLLHPGTGSRALAPELKRQVTVRLQLTAVGSADPVVVDGVVHEAMAVGEVQVTTAGVVPLEVKNVPSVAVWQLSAAEVAQMLVEGERQEPDEPPFAPPEPPSEGEGGPHPWWCNVIPFCPGCN